MVNEGFEYKGYKINGCLENNSLLDIIDRNSLIRSSNFIKRCLMIIINTKLTINSMYYDNIIMIHDNNIEKNIPLYDEIKNSYETVQIGNIHYFYDVPEEEMFYLKLKYNIVPSFFLYIKDIKIEKITLS